MIHVLATIQIFPGRRAEFLAEVDELLPLVRAEDGCIEYGPAIEIESLIPVQAKIRPDVVTMVEKWRDIEALIEHLSAPHMVAYRQRVRDLVDWVDLRIMEPALT